MRNMTRIAIAAATLGLAASIAVVPAHAGFSEDVTGDWAALDTNTAAGQTHWTPDAPQVASLDSHFVDANTARLVYQPNDQNNLGTSFEIADLNMPAGENATAYFSWKLEDGAVAGGGAPRLFVAVETSPGVIVYRNTADHGGPNSDPGSLGDWDGDAIVNIPAGTVRHVGIVYDNGVVGSVVVSRPVIDDTGILFPTGDDTDDEDAKNFGKIVSELAKSPDEELEHAKGKGALSKRN